MLKVEVLPKKKNQPLIDFICYMDNVYNVKIAKGLYIMQRQFYIARSLCGKRKDIY